MSAAEDLRQMAYGFDQETAAVLLARQAVHQTLTQEPLDVIRYMDRLLIKLVARFAEYKKDDPSTFKLSREFGLFPQFMFYLRRGQFLHTFNASPDESEYYREMIFKENVSNSLVMIQPSLMMYKLDAEEAQPALLDGDAMQDQVILLLDTFFYVSIWKGQTINDWEKAGYHEQPEYQNLKNMLEVPIEDAQYIMQERFPMPRFYVTCPDDTNERKFKSKLNPGTGQKNAEGESTIQSEDVNLNVFM